MHPSFRHVYLEKNQTSFGRARPVGYALTYRGQWPQPKAVGKGPFLSPWLRGESHCRGRTTDLQFTTEPRRTRRTIWQPQRNALLRLHLRRQMARTGRNVTGQPAPLYRPGDAWPGGCRDAIGHFPALLTDWRATRPRPPKPLYPRNVCATLSAIERERYSAAAHPLDHFGMFDKQWLCGK